MSDESKEKSDSIDFDRLLNSIDNITNRIKFIRSIVYSLTVLVLIALLSIFVIQYIAFIKEDTSSFTNKKVLFSKFRIAIENNADLDVVKTIYVNRNEIKRSLFSFSSTDSIEISYKLTLDESLKMLKSELYSNPTRTIDTVLISKIDRIINENNILYPFESLEDLQKNYFENIQIKSGTNYPLIQDDVNRLSVELTNKNRLVLEYLRDSTLSFYISITALLFSVIISIYQIFQSRETKLVRILKKHIFEKNT